MTATKSDADGAIHDSNPAAGGARTSPSASPNPKAKQVDDPRGCCRCDAPPPNWQCSFCGEVVCLDCYGPDLGCNECIYDGNGLDLRQ